MMNLRTPLIQSVVMVVIALLIAVVANGFASRTRRLVLPGYYPNALRVPPRVPATVPPPAVLEPPVGETAQSPAPGQPPITIPTETIERPAGAAAAATAQPIVAPEGDPRQSAIAAPTPTGSPAPAAPATPAANPLDRFRPAPDRPSIDISGPDASLLHARGVLFLDARRTAAYEEGHVAGARNFSVWEADIDQKVNALYSERSNPEEQDLPIVIYCSGGECEDSHMLAQKLWGIQFNNVYVYKDGYPDWLRRGGAVRKGNQP